MPEIPTIPETAGWYVNATPEGDVYAEPVVPPAVTGLIALPASRAATPAAVVSGLYRFEDGGLGHAPTVADRINLRSLAGPERIAATADFEAVRAALFPAPVAPISPPVIAPAALVPVGGGAPPALGGAPGNHFNPAAAPPAGFVWFSIAVKRPVARGTVLDHSEASVSAQVGSVSLMSFPDGSIVSAELIKNEEIAELTAPKGLGGPGGVVPDAVKAFRGSEDDARTLHLPPHLLFHPLGQVGLLKVLAQPSG